jgi:serine/threonine-protein kinase RsbW
MNDKTNRHKIKIKRTLKSNLNNILNFENELVEKLNSLEYIDKKIIFQIRLAFHEAIINVIIHTYKKDPSNDIDIEIVVEHDLITIKIRDYGKPVDIATIKSRDLDELKENGLGVHFYKTLMDNVVYTRPDNNHGNIIILKKNLS